MKPRLLKDTLAKNLYKKTLNYDFIIFKSIKLVLFINATTSTNDSLLLNPA